MARRAVLRWTLVFAALAAFGVGLSMVAHELASRYQDERIRARFGEYLSVQAMRIEGEVQSLGEVLYSVQGLFDASEEVERGEFATFVRGPLARLPAVRALEWVPLVAHEQRAHHERITQAEGYPSYSITEQCEGGPVCPAAERNAYFPVHYVEPLEQNEAALGLDLGSEPMRYDVLRRAFSSQQPTISEPLTLIQEEGDSRSVLMGLPVMRAGTPTSSKSPARGFVVLVIRIQDLLTQALPPPDEDEPERMTFELIEEVDEGDHLHLYVSPGFEESTPTVNRRIEAGRRDWTLRATPTPAFLTARETHQPLLLALIVFVLWVGLISALFALGRYARNRDLRQNTQVIRSVLANLNEGVVVADASGTLLFINPMARLLVGPGTGRAQQGDWSATYGFFKADLLTPYPEDELPLARAIRGENVEEEEIFVRNPRRPDGVWLNAIATPLRDEDGELQGGIVVLRDVTKRRESEAQIRRLSNAVEQTADAVFIADRDGVIEYVNPAFEVTTGYTKEEAIGKTPRILKSGRHKSNVYERLWNAVLKGEVFHTTLLNRRKDGSQYYSEQTITPMRNAEGHITHFVAVSRDMTERRRLQEQEVEVELAAQIQQGLYPKSSPALPGLQVSGAVYPAEATCGDYFDYITLPDGRLAIAVGDVSGHGLGPALIMSQVRAYLRSLVGNAKDVGDALGQLNDVLTPDLESGLFVTMVVTCIDPKERRVIYASAGHTPCFVLRSDGSIRHSLRYTGIPLGVDHGARYEARDGIVLERGDVLLLLTDGVTDARSPDGNFLLDEGVLDLVRDHLHESAQAIVERLHRGIRAFSSTDVQLDDITMVVCKCVEESHPEPDAAS